jgi:excisionase family DNA binding protein
MDLSRSSQPSHGEPLPSRDDQLTVAEALACLKMARSTFYRHIAEGRIAAIKGPGPIRLHKDTVRALAPTGSAS